MERKLKPISTGNPDLNSIIENDNLYVDKTKYIYSLISSKSIDNIFFLSRPRRFGKSLTVDTLEQIFRGNRELFKGLYIYDKYDFEPYPVIRLNMNDLRAESYDSNVEMLLDVLYQKAVSFSVENEINNSISEPFYYLSKLLNLIYEKTGKQIVLLIDEYDYPLLQLVHDNEKFNTMRDMLASFYETIKADGKMIKFCFITGITRFQQVSIFSKLNNLIDISSSPEYAALCGYTDEEMDHYFAPYMENYYEKNSMTKAEDKEVFRKSIKDYYDGYRFSIRSGVTMYNPVSVGKFFMGGCSFENFWIETGSQSLVDEIVKKYPNLFGGGKGFYTYESYMNTLNVNEIFLGEAKAESVYSYLVQAGYLTIRGTEYGKLLLSYPNREVGDTMETAL